VRHASARDNEHAKTFDDEPWVIRIDEFPKSGRPDWSKHGAGEGEITLRDLPIKVAQKPISKTSQSNQVIG